MITEKMPVKEVASLAKAVACEGAVLLKNDGNVLPVLKDEVVSVFGRTQFDYVKSGTGSGGMVNVEYVTNITDSLKKYVRINEELENIYRDWIKENPFDKGEGWAQEPWFQKEMDIDEEHIKRAGEISQKAIIVIGRTAGEDKDNSAAKGSYYLTDSEYSLIKNVRKYFGKVSVLLNVGNIIDMTWVSELDVPSVMYIWQGGMEGGSAAAEIISGRVSPSGKLPDTIMKDLEKYPAMKNFGNEVFDLYEEDIYVGYRYFETFAKDEVLYPFGFGLSYTYFEIKTEDVRNDGENIYITASVKNIGKMSGKEVIEVYVKAPQGYMGRPERELVAFAKTKLLNPEETQTLTLSFPIFEMKTYCDYGEYKFSYILEKGSYEIYVGNNVRDAEKAGTYENKETIIAEKLSSALAPQKSFNRIKRENDKISYEEVPTRIYDLEKRINDNRPESLEITGDKGIKLKDVKNGKNSIDEFIAQLKEDDLMCISRGEGMNSPKVTPGTACAFGGVTKRLFDFGIPIGCCTDGPSGLRLDNGAKATSLPNGTCISSSWNTELTEELFKEESKELIAYNIDALLGPGINIHRTPLNGRNFEYFSEDPYLTGAFADAICSGLSAMGTSAVIKHFICNEQEFKRLVLDSVVSERALREIYLKPFEMAVKSGKVKYIMTSYNLINGISAAASYDLNTTVLRDEWGFNGMVMTDWWPLIRKKTDEEGSRENIAEMSKAQNDVFMVVSSAEFNADNLKESLENGFITVGELQRNAKNICRVLMDMPVFDRKEDIYEYSGDNRKFAGKYENVTGKIYVRLPKGRYEFNLIYCLNSSVLSQNIITLQTQCEKISLTLKGTDGSQTNFTQEITFNSEITELEFVGGNGLLIRDMFITQIC